MKEWADREYTDEECEQVWVQFVENVTSRALGFKMNAAYIYSINEAAREEQRKALEKARAAAERSSKRTAVVLDSFCDGNNTLEKITGALVELARLKAPVESPMPNYGKIAKAAGKAEADLIDAYYQAYMAKKAEAILARTAAMDQRDERVLMLKYYCQSGLNRPRKEIIATLDSILKLNPQNDRALKLKLYLETEYGGK